MIARIVVAVGLVAGIVVVGIAVVGKSDLERQSNTVVLVAVAVALAEALIE